MVTRESFKNSQNAAMNAMGTTFYRSEAVFSHVAVYRKGISWVKTTGV